MVTRTQVADAREGMVEIRVHIVEHRGLAARWCRRWRPARPHRTGPSEVQGQDIQAQAVILRKTLEGQGKQLHRGVLREVDEPQLPAGSGEIKGLGLAVRLPNAFPIR